MKENYFEKKIEPRAMPITEEDRRISRLRLMEPMIEAPKFYKDAGEINSVNEKFGFSLKFRSSEYEDVMMFHNSRYTPPEELEKRWRVLDELQFKAGDDVLDLNDVIPPGWRAMFRADRPGVVEGGSTHNKDKTVLINGDISTPVGILTFLHEAGHANIIEKEGEEKIKTLRIHRNEFDEARRKNKIITSDDIDSVVKEERDAWAFALKNVKPLLKSGVADIKDIKSYLHNVALRSYSDEARSLIEKGLIVDDI